MDGWNLSYAWDLIDNMDVNLSFGWNLTHHMDEIYFYHLDEIYPYRWKCWVGWGGVGWGRDNGKGERVHGLCVRERARLWEAAREWVREREIERERERISGVFGRWRSVVRCWTVAISVCKQSSSMRWTSSTALSPSTSQYQFISLVFFPSFLPFNYGFGFALLVLVVVVMLVSRLFFWFCFFLSSTLIFLSNFS
jgi:hypothetical protein